MEYCRTKGVGDNEKVAERNSLSGILVGDYLFVSGNGGELDSTGCWKQWWRVVVDQRAT